MPRSRSRRFLALVTAAAVLATMSAATVTSPVSAAKKPKCMGFKATIVGTNKADVITGTAKRDVIVAKAGADKVYGRGGNDVICAGPGNDKVAGQAGHDRIAGQTGIDRLFGGAGVDTLMGNAGDDFLAGQAGPDVLAGGVGNDRLDGGIGVDTCLQNSGTGLKARCELPVAPLKDLAIAYSDIDGLDGYGAGDVLIAKLVDANRDGVPSKGDSIVMDRYPVDLNATGFAGWGVKSQSVQSIGDQQATSVLVVTATGSTHEWINTGAKDEYRDIGGSGGSVFYDCSAVSCGVDYLSIDTTSPSAPSVASPYVEIARQGDDPFIDVDLYY